MRPQGIESIERKFNQFSVLIFTRLWLSASLSEAIILPLPTREWLRKTQSFSDSTRTTNSSDTVFVTLGLTFHREQVSEKECFAVVDTYLCPSFESHLVLACDSGTIEVLLTDGTAPLLCLQILTPRSREEMGYQCLLARS